VAVLRKAAVTVLGWLLILVGLAALALPGPGLLLLLGGLVVLSGEYTWAARHRDRVRRKALEAARTSVATYRRIALSVGSACLVIAAGVVWWIDPVIPEVALFGPRLPFGGWGTGLGIVVSGLVALGLMVHSLVTYRGGPPTKSGPSSTPPI
jgi:Putative transmembrane protein (PGPGW)